MKCIKELHWRIWFDIGESEVSDVSDGVGSALAKSGDGGSRL